MVMFLPYAVNCAVAERRFDADGRMTANDLASYTYDAAGRITSITQQLWAKRTVTVGAVTTTELYQHPISWLASFHSRNRLTGLRACL